jgi:hypothetical protein
MNLLPSDKLAELEKCFGEGRGVRETARLIGVHRDTVSRYFRLLRDPAPGATEDIDASPANAHFAAVEHEDDWHVFYIHDDTPEWWRHVATFHTEQRARLYAEDCESWLTVVAAGPDEIADTGHPLADEAIAPATLPAPLPIPDTAIEQRLAARKKRTAEREQKHADRERQWDAEAAVLPERYCEICQIVLVRRPDERVNSFSIRQTCSTEHAKKLIRKRRTERANPGNGVAEPASQPPADNDEGVETPQAHVLPPGYRDCPDCIWSGPLTQYRDHRASDHPQGRYNA